MSPIFLWACFLAGVSIFAMLFVQRMNDYEELSEDFKHLHQSAQNTHEIQNAFAHKLDALQEQVDHLATVQMLLLKDLGKEHRVEPARNVLVTVSPLSELKKGRSA